MRRLIHACLSMFGFMVEATKREAFPIRSMMVQRCGRLFSGVDQLSRWTSWVPVPSGCGLEG